MWSLPSCEFHECCLLSGSSSGTAHDKEIDDAVLRMAMAMSEEEAQHGSQM